MAGIGSEGALAGYDNIFQIQRIRNEQTINTNRWSLQFSGLKSMLEKAKNSPLKAVRDRYEACRVAFDVNNSGRESETVETILELALFSVSIPTIKLETQDITRFNDSTKTVTKFAPMEDLSVVFWDYVDGSASAIMQLWHALVGDKVTGAIGFKRDFVLPEAFFYVYGPDAPGYGHPDTTVDDSVFMDSNKIPYLQKYNIWNLFPNDVQLGEHSDNAEARKVTCSFSCDNIFLSAVQTYGVDYNYINADNIPS